MATTLNLSLPESLKAYLDSQVEAKHYDSPGDYVQDLIQHDRDRHLAETGLELAELERRLLRALSSEEGSLELTADQIRGGGVVAMIREHRNSTR